MQTNNHLHTAASWACRNVLPQSNDSIALKGLKITALVVTTFALLYSIHVAYTVSLGKAAPQFLLSLVPVVISVVAAHLSGKQEAKPPAGSTITVIHPLEDMPKLPDTPQAADNFLRAFCQTVLNPQQLPPLEFVQQCWGTQLKQNGWTVKQPNNLDGVIRICDSSQNQNPIVDLYVEKTSDAGTQLSIRSEFVMPQLPRDKDAARTFLVSFKPCKVPRQNEFPSSFVNRHWGEQLKTFGWTSKVLEADSITIFDELNQSIIKLKFESSPGIYSIESDNKES
jgi:hypothetical protein